MAKKETRSGTEITQERFHELCTTISALSETKWQKFLKSLK